MEMLLIMVSRNDYMLEHPFSEVLASEEGIDGWIERPVNKPYSSFIYSSVNVDTDFEQEWNNFYRQRKEKGLKCLSYREINTALDQIKKTIINGGTKALNKEVEKDMSYIIQIIFQFYNERLDNLIKQGVISKEKRRELAIKFSDFANNIIRTMNRAIQPDGR